MLVNAMVGSTSSCFGPATGEVYGRTFNVLSGRSAWSPILLVIATLAHEASVNVSKGLARKVNVGAACSVTSLSKASANEPIY